MKIDIAQLDATFKPRGSWARYLVLGMPLMLLFSWVPLVMTEGIDKLSQKTVPQSATNSRHEAPVFGLLVPTQTVALKLRAARRF